MAGGQWEVVSTKNKKSKSKVPVSKTSSKEKNKENHLLEASAPIRESQTIYDVFTEKEKKMSNGAVPKAAAVEKKQQQQQPMKKKKEKKPFSKISVKEALASVTELELQDHLATLQVLAANAPLLWLKDLTAFFNIRVHGAEDFDPSSQGHPSTLLNKKVYKIIMELLNRCTPQMLQIFHEFCVQNMVQDCLKGFHNVVGYRILLQCVAQHSPSVTLANLSKCSDLCNQFQNRQNICLSVLWAAGLAGNNNFQAGFKVWRDLMLPLIGSKNCSTYAVEYIEKLLSQHDISKNNKSLLEVRDLFPILDFIYSKELAKNIQKRLIVVYPSLKALSYGPQPEGVLRNYFPSFLRRLESHCSQPLKEELLRSLVECLEKDVQCFSIWRQLYTKHLPQSKLLIAHLAGEWEKRGLRTRIPNKPLRDTLAAFHVTNDEIAAGGSSECKELLLKLNAGAISWSFLFLLFFLILSFALTIDIWMHGSFSECVTGELLKSLGMFGVFAQAGDKLVHFYRNVIVVACKQHFPAVGQWLNTVCLPILEAFVQHLNATTILLWQSTAPLRAWVHLNIPPLLATVEEVIVVQGLLVWSWLSQGLLLSGRWFANAVDSLAVNLQSSPAVEQILKVTATAVENVQHNAIYFIHVLKSYVPT